MMTRNTLFPLCVLFAFLAVACENDIPFSHKDNPPKLVINALINADSVNNKLFLHLTDPNNLKEVKKAVVEISVNGIQTEVAQPIAALPNGNYPLVAAYYRITTAFHPGDVVRINARTADGVHHAWAEVTVPQPIAISQVDTATTRIRYNDSFLDVLRYRFTFNDPPKEKNFYRLVIEQRTAICVEMYESKKDTIIHTKSTHLISGDDIVLSDGQPDMGNSDSMFEKATNIYGIFDDSRLGSDAYTMTAYSYKNYFWFPHYGENKWTETDVYLRLLSISETEYYYLKALNIIDSDVYDKTMMEPIKFASNIHGGIGIVGISTETSTKISLPREIYQ